ncbi:MAG: hypothetical protein AAF628_07775 [Planctomycetota bacterium]
MYSFLRRFLPPRAAGVALALWYGVLLLLVLVLVDSPWQEFRYGDV